MTTLGCHPFFRKILAGRHRHCAVKCPPPLPAPEAPTGRDSMIEPSIRIPPLPRWRDRVRVPVAAAVAAAVAHRDRVRVPVAVAVVVAVAHRDRVRVPEAVVVAVVVAVARGNRVRVPVAVVEVPSTPP